MLVIPDVDGSEVFKWPEFEALCYKLGLDPKLQLSSFNLDVQGGKRPIVRLSGSKMEKENVSTNTTDHTYAG